MTRPRPGESWPRGVRHNTSVQQWYKRADGMTTDTNAPLDLYLRLGRSEWAALRQSTPLTLTETDLDRLRGVNERVSMSEVEEVYLPLSRLLNLHVTGSRSLAEVTYQFLGTPRSSAPYIIGIAGSVAVGKSTTARLLEALLSSWPAHPRVDLVTTDGFLYPNRVLAERGLMKRKGFPESYDTKRLLRFLAAVKAGQRNVDAPVYSHQEYDVIDGASIRVDRPDILIVEGLNVLQPNRSTAVGEAKAFVSDFFDFSIYVHAEEALVKRWFLERFAVLRQTAFRDETSYFRRYATMAEDEAMTFADSVWEQVNAVNLRENILPTRDRATLVLTKRQDHAVQCVDLRRR